MFMPELIFYNIILCIIIYDIKIKTNVNILWYANRNLGVQAWNVSDTYIHGVEESCKSRQERVLITHGMKWVSNLPLHFGKKNTSEILSPPPNLIKI